MMRGKAGEYKSSAEWSRSGIEHQSNMMQPASQLPPNKIYKDWIGAKLRF
jgi:hypothetical protein